jgi:hypothetical protein
MPQKQRKSTIKHMGPAINSVYQYTLKFQSHQTNRRGALRCYGEDGVQKNVLPLLDLNGTKSRLDNFKFSRFGKFKVILRLLLHFYKKGIQNMRDRGSQFYEKNF